ncbi:hypothetical protein [Mycobacterium avium]|uniref:hypothetical protein n=1 Tax=Mycobacterium avium TaxID=1764 RepID=UPI000A0475AC|nr:hypothetical protein [Mycobacterium avium]
MTAVLDAVQLRSLLLEEIERAGAITTGALAARLPAKDVVVDVPCNPVCQYATRWSQAAAVLDDQPGLYRTRARRTTKSIYRQLRVLEDSGLITGLRGTGARGVLWVCGGDDVDGLGEDFVSCGAGAGRPIITPTLKEGLL